MCPWALATGPAPVNYTDYTRKAHRDTGTAAVDHPDTFPPDKTGHSCAERSFDTPCTDVVPIQKPRRHTGPEHVRACRPTFDVLNEVVVVPATRTIRGLSSEVELGIEDGMPTECALNFDHVAVAQR